MIQGQEKICEKVNRLTLDKFPRSLMLVGAYGSGKHMIVDYISKKFNLQVIDITKNLDKDSIEELYDRVEPYLYIIRANELSVKDENTILKFIEEPLKNSYIVLLAETEIGLLQTILNRCQIWYLQNYNIEFLRQFTDGDDLVLEIATTPGQVKDLRNNNFKDMLDLADKIVDNIHLASVANTLSLSNKISFKDDSNKFDVRLFTDVLIHRITSRYKSLSDNRYLNAYNLTSELRKKLSVKNLDKKALFEGYLICLRSIMREEHVS